MSSTTRRCNSCGSVSATSGSFSSSPKSDDSVLHSLNENSFLQEQCSKVDRNYSDYVQCDNDIFNTYSVNKSDIDNREANNSFIENALISTLDISCIDMCSDNDNGSPEIYNHISRSSIESYIRRKESFSLCDTRRQMGLRQLPSKISSSTIRSYDLDEDSSIVLDSEFYSITEEELRDSCCIGKEKTLNHFSSGLSDKTVFMEDELYQLPITDKAFDQSRPSLLKRIKNYTKRRNKKSD